MCRVNCQLRYVSEELLLAELDDRSNFLMVFMGYTILVSVDSAPKRQHIFDLPLYFVWEITSPSNSVKYGRSSRRNLASMTRASRVWYEVNWPPRSSDSLVMRRADRL